MTFHITRGRLVAFVAVGALLLAVSAGGAAASSSRAQSGLTIFAGSSMTNVLPAIDSTNTYSFGSTGTLATQITNGAPCRRPDGGEHDHLRVALRGGHR